MAFQVSRTDTGQFVLIDPATDTVVIDDELAVGFAKLERVVVDKPPKPTASPREGTGSGRWRSAETALSAR